MSPDNIVNIIIKVVIITIIGFFDIDVPNQKNIELNDIFKFVFILF